MANPEHVKIVQQGKVAIAEWRKSRDEKRLYFPVLDLSGAHLTRAGLSDADLSDADLSGVDLSGAVLSDAVLKRAGLKEADLSETNLTRANLRGADLPSADLSEADLSVADLTLANLREADLTGANLCRANLREADLTGANLCRVKLREADLTGANLSRANLSLARLTGANFNEARFASTGVLNVDLSTAMNLERVFHRGPSSIGIDTLLRSQGKIPEAFLRGCGVPDDFITYIPSLLSTGIEFYSAFISYSHKDEEFANRLHARMQQEHLRVWFAPEDMKGGEHMHDQIFDAIRVHDKLLLLLSPESMGSKWVASEILRARKRETNDGKRVLFPISLTDMSTIKAWELFDTDAGEDLAAEIRKYHIPDFSNWKNHDVFEKAFTRLLRDLKQSQKNPKPE
ncbi:MAG: toll/interleukin-1 receptor domain-containing protein [Planctomycetaceae bacterium]|nr:toll/interleukin-1 receptor domain-containing protein [Planctomycetaceae bacterium]